MEELKRNTDGTYADPQIERLYRSYRDDRNGNRLNDPMSHAQIVSDGPYGAFAEGFALRYSIDLSRYADAMIERNKLNGWTAPSAGLSTDGRPLNADHVQQVPDRPLQP